MSRVDQPSTEEYEGQTIVRVSHRWWDIRLTLVDRIRNTDGITRQFYRMLLNGVRARDWLSIVFSRVSVKKALINAYIEALNNLEEPPDVVVPFCYPVEAVCAGIDYKKRVKEVKLIPYLFDPIVEGKPLHKSGVLMMLKSHRHLALEKTILDSATGVMVVNFQERYFRTHFPENLDNIHFMEHPLVKQVHVRNEQIILPHSFEGCILVYTGSFIRGCRLPGYMLNVLFLAKTRLDFTLHLYGGGSGYSAIKKWQSRMSDSVVYHGHVDKNTALGAIRKANILVNVGETRGVQVSSKIFEYISTGKPIVHFYTAEQDANVRILEDYPLCLCLKQENALLEENANKLVSFIERHRNSTLAFDEVERVYHYATPRVIASQMMEVIKGH